MVITSSSAGRRASDDVSVNPRTASSEANAATCNGLVRVKVANAPGGLGARKLLNCDTDSVAKPEASSTSASTTVGTFCNSLVNTVEVLASVNALTDAAVKSTGASPCDISTSTLS